MFFSRTWLAASQRTDLRGACTVRRHYSDAQDGAPGLRLRPLRPLGLSSFLRPLGPGSLPNPDSSFSARVSWTCCHRASAGTHRTGTCHAYKILHGFQTANSGTHVEAMGLGLGGAIRDPRFLHSSDLPGSEFFSIATVSLLPAMTLTPKCYVEISKLFLKHP